ncbi:MAG: glycosyltransferase [Acidobacteria bacterium]|nr:glycosyltransferase [Acidobacteriota bacterium]
MATVPPTAPPLTAEAPRPAPRPAAVQPEVSFLWVFDEADARLPEILARYVEVLRGLTGTSELIIVDNGVGGAAAAQLIEVASREQIAVRVLRFHRWAGESACLTAAFKESRGRIIVVLPSYLQVAPDDVALLVDKVRTGELDCVASWRWPRVDRAGAASQSALFNRLTRAVSHVPLHDINSGLRAMRREVAEHVAVYGDLGRFLPILAAMQGFRVGEVKVRHLEERVRRGDYRVGVYVRRLLDLITLFFLIKFTRKPLRFFGLVGSALLASGGFVLAWLTVERLLGRSIGDRPLLVLGVLVIVLGIQMFSIGLLGELIIYTHARDMKDYHVEKVL